MKLKGRDWRDTWEPLHPCVHLSGFRPVGTLWTSKAFVTTQSMAVECPETGCQAKSSDCYLQHQGHWWRLKSLKTARSLSLCLSLLKPNLFWCRQRCAKASEFTRVQILSKRPFRSMSMFPQPYIFGIPSAVVSAVRCSSKPVFPQPYPMF